MSVFAPLHNRAELEGIDIVEKYLDNVPQVAVFDTGFHSRLPEAAAVYPGPYQWLAFDDTAFTESIISTARSALHKFWAANLAR